MHVRNRPARRRAGRVSLSFPCLQNAPAPPLARWGRDPIFRPAWLQQDTALPRLLGTSATIVAVDLTLLVIGVPRLWALAGTLLVTLVGVLALAAVIGRQARRLQGSTSPRRIA